MGLTAVLIYILIILLSVIVYFVRRNLNYWKDRGIPYVEPHLIYGNIKGFRKTRNLHDNIFEHYEKFRGQSYPFVGFYFMNQPAAFIMDPKLIKNILIKDFSNFVNRNQFHNERDDPLSAHLFNLEGMKWRRLRNKLSSTFTSGKMKYMFPAVVSVADRLINVFSDMIRNDSGTSLEIKDLMARFTTDVIGTCAFGIECNSLQDPNTLFRTMGNKSLTETRHNSAIIAFMLGFPHLARKLRMRIVANDVHDFFMRMVYETVTLREKEQIRRNDFMDLLIDLKNKKSLVMDDGKELTGLTMNELAAQAFVFFLAGFETSSSTMSYALYELAQNQEVQEKLRNEINEVMGNNQANLTYDTMRKMEYMNQVISETLRLYTIVPFLQRKAIRDYIVPDNPKYIIEKNTVVIIPACALHRDPDLYPEPWQFKPERFSPEMVAARDSVEWLPFGDGPRNCIGMRFGQMQASVGLALLIKNFKFSVCTETVIPLKWNPKLFVLSTVDGIHLNVKRL